MPEDFFNRDMDPTVQPLVDSAFSGYAYLDMNNNGQLDSNEPHALTQPDNPATDLDELGTYRLTGLPAGTPVVRTLDNGSVAIVQRSPLSPTVHLKLVLAGAVHLDGAEVRSNDPAWGVTSLDLELLPQELDAALAGIAARLAQTVPADPDDTSDANDPQARLERHFRDILGLQAAGVAVRVADELEGEPAGDEIGVERATVAGVGPA